MILNWYGNEILSYVVVSIETIIMTNNEVQVVWMINL